MTKFIKPQLGEVDHYMVTINGIRILVVTNVGNILCSIVPIENYTLVEEKDIDSEVPTIYVLFNKAIDSNYTVRSDNKIENKTIHSTEEVSYPNQIYCLDNQKVVFNYYPNNSIILSDSDKKTHIIVASTKEVLIFYLKMYLKKVVLCTTQNLCVLHASSIGIESGGFAFLGQGNAGKSTLALNLTQYGWKMLNDDLIFLSHSSEHITIRGIDVNPCIRGEAISFIENSDFLLGNNYSVYNKYHDCYYLTSIDTLKLSIPLKAFFLLQKDFNNSQFLSEITDSNIKKELLQKFNRNNFAPEDQLFLKLCQIPMYYLNITHPVSEIDAYLKSFV